MNRYTKFEKQLLDDIFGHNVDDDHFEPDICPSQYIDSFFMKLTDIPLYRNRRFMTENIFMIRNGNIFFVDHTRKMCIEFKLGIGNEELGSEIFRFQNSIMEMKQDKVSITSINDILDAFKNHGIQFKEFNKILLFDCVIEEANRFQFVKYDVEKKSMNLIQTEKRNMYKTVYGLIERKVCPNHFNYSNLFKNFHKSYTSCDICYMLKIRDLPMDLIKKNTPLIENPLNESDIEAMVLYIFFGSEPDERVVSITKTLLNDMFKRSDG